MSKSCVAVRTVYRRPRARAAPVPLVTIAVPAYNRPAMLAETLDSIAAQTAATEFEVVVCDDGRLSETRALVERYSRSAIRYLPNPEPLGAVGNWNRCLQAARGEWVMVLHEDDTLYPWYLECTLPRLRPGIAALCMRTSRGLVRPGARPPRAGTPVVAYPPRLFLKSSMTPFPGVLLRRDVALRLGGFDEKWGPLADYEFWYRLACAGRIEVIRSVGAFYRVAPGQWTERVWGRMLALAHLLRLRIAREQLPRSPRTGRWLARFFTCGNARSYAARFRARPAILRRCLKLSRGPLAALPSGWVWLALKFASWKAGRKVGWLPHAGRTPQIQQGGRRPDRLVAAHPL